MRGRDQIIFLLSRLAPGIAGFALTAVLTRYLAPAEYGRYGLGMSIILFVSTAGFEWLGLSVLRLAPGASDRARFAKTINRLFYGLAALAALVSGVVILTPSGLNWDPAVIGLSLICAIVYAAFELRARWQLVDHRSVAFLRMNGLRAVLNFGAGATAARLGGDALWILAAATAAIGLSALAGGWRSGADQPAEAGGVAVDDRAILAFGAPFIVTMILGALITSVDRWMINGMLGAGPLGLYSAAYLVSQIPIIFLSSGIGPTAYVRSVRALDLQGPAAARSQLRNNLALLVGLFLPAALIIALLSRNLAASLVGAQFRDAVVTLSPWLAGAGLLFALRGTYFDTAFQLARQTRPMILRNFVLLSVIAALNWLLIPRFGILGAAYAGFGGNAFGLIASAVVGRRYFKLPLWSRDMGKVLIAAAAMTAAVLALPPRDGAQFLLLQLTLCAVTYCGALILLDIGGARSARVPQVDFVARHLLGRIFRTRP